VVIIFNDINQPQHRSVIDAITGTGAWMWEGSHCWFSLPAEA